MTPATPHPAPLFITGTARAGTNLLARMLSAHPAVEVAIDPYMPLLRSFRNAVISRHCDESTAARYSTAPFQDYYFTDERLQVMDAIQAADLDIAFAQEERSALVQAVTERAGLESPDLEPLLGQLSGATYRELFDSALAIIVEARSAAGCEWVGMKEVWSVEFCSALARAYPHARFVVIMRDPRAVVASMHQLAEKDVTQRAHTLSYARHWRKCAAFCTFYASQPWLSGRFHVVRYEDLVADRARGACAVCDFLGLQVVPEMECGDGFWDPATRTMWRGNSSYAARVEGTATAIAERWRTTLDPAALALIELVCGPEMALFGYAPSMSRSVADPQALEFLIRDSEMPGSWRSDLENVQEDYGFELFRLAAFHAQSLTDEKTIRRCFLFSSVLDAVRSASLRIPA